MITPAKSIAVSSSLTIGGLAKLSGVHVETIRFYQRQQLLPTPDRPLGGIRRYAQADSVRIGFIKAAQKLGFSLEEVSDLLAMNDGGGCAAIRTSAQAKLHDVQARIKDLQQIEKVLNTLIEDCANNPNHIKCPMIHALEQPTALARHS